MSFSESAGVITQTGTDTNLSGLNGLTGVNRIGYTTTGSESFYIYNIGTNRLDIEGNLTINPEYNMFLTNCPTGLAPNMSINVRSTGTLTLGEKTVSGTATKYTIGTAIIATQRGNLNNKGSLHVESGGTLEGYGATIELSGPTRLINGSYLTVEDLTVIIARNGQCQFRIEHSGVNTANVSITNNGIRMNGKSSLDEANLTTNGNTAFDPNSFIFSLVKAKYQPASAGYPPQVFLDFDNGNNVASADFSYAGSGAAGGTDFNGVLVDFRNVARRLRYTNANANGGFCQTTKNVNFNLVGADFVGLTDVAYHAVDTDNGGRINFNLFDSTADLVYTDSDVGPLVSVSPVVEYMAGQGTTRHIDDRLDNDTITFRFISYLTNVSTSSPNLIGIGDIDLDIVNPSDSLITETNNITVDAYTELETSAKFYDRAKSYLYDNFNGEDSTIIARSGNTIDAGSYNVDIDAIATSAFAFDGSKITIKASEFTGNITTSGTITLLNGAKIIGNATDSSGTVTTLPYLITGLIAGSNVRVYNVTADSEFFVRIVSGTSTSGTYTEGVEISAGDTIDIYTVNTNGTTAYYENTVTIIASDSGLNGLVNQELNVIYNDNGVDGSTVTGISLDVPNVEFDLDEADDTISSQEIYAWYMNELMTADGIRNIYKAITPKSQYRYCIDPSVVDLKLDNKDLVNSLAITNGYFYSLDNTSVIASGSGNIEMIPKESYVADSTQISEGLEDIETKVDNIETKTESDSRQVILISEHNQTQTDISNLNDFDPASDDVAKVNLVDVTTTNSDMRGTDNANTVSPDNSGITQIQTDISNLNDISASDVYTEFTSGTNEDAFKADVSGLSTFDPANDDVNTNVASRNASKADVSNLSTFDPNSDDVTTDSASREASKADVTDLATKDNQEVVNDGVKKASLLIPHSDNLPD
mgnify:FL=1